MMTKEMNMHCNFQEEQFNMCLNRTHNGHDIKSEDKIR